jgi:hypothetical protein
VHFFLEKIPSRAMEQYTPLDPLDEIISSLPMEQQAPPLRTRALVQIFKRQWEGAILDLTMALRITEEIRRSHKPDQQQLELASKMREEQETWNKGYRDWRAVPQLKDEEQPSSLEKQLLFNRAGVYLALAYQSVHTALDGLKEYQEAQVNGEVGLDTRAQDVRLDARKRVKGFAKKAIKDYMAFLGHFDYTPGLSFEITNEIMRRVHDLANGNKTQTPLPKSRLVEINASDDESSHSDGTEGKQSNSNALVRQQNPKTEPFELGEDGWPKFPAPKIHPVSALFAEKPLADLPPTDTNDSTHTNKPLHAAFNSREAVTYHPLMLDALHSLLLAHALVQTSATFDTPKTPHVSHASQTAIPCSNKPAVRHALTGSRSSGEPTTGSVSACPGRRCAHQRLYPMKRAAGPKKALHPLRCLRRPRRRATHSRQTDTSQASVERKKRQTRSASALSKKALSTPSRMTG